MSIHNKQWLFVNNVHKKVQSLLID